MKCSAFFLICLALGLLGSCKEETPAVNFSAGTATNDTTYISDTVQAGSQPKNILIEDFTGVNCPNCPRAQQKAKEIQDNSAMGRVVVVAIHPGPPVFNELTSPLTTPPHISKYNFRTEDGKNLIGLLGMPQGLPAVAINRKKFNGEQEFLILNLNSWPSYVSQELAAGSPVRLGLIKLNYDSASRKLAVRVRVTYTQAVLDTNFLTLGLTESGMIDVQKDVFAYVPDYEHNHVLRKLITTYTGDAIIVNKTVGRVIEREYTVKLNAEWKVTNMSVYAVVHQNAVKREVLQVSEAAIY